MDWKRKNLIDSAGKDLKNSSECVEDRLEKPVFLNDMIYSETSEMTVTDFCPQAAR